MYNFHYSFNLDPWKVLNHNFMDRFKDETYYEKLWDGDMFRVINKDFLNYLNTQLPIQNIICFYKIKNSGAAKNPPWHLDYIDDFNNKTKCSFGLNIIPKIENGTSLMEWGEFKESVIKDNSLAKEPICYENTEVDSLYRTNIDDTVSLVNLKHPHRIILDSEKRFCASIRFHKKVKNWYDILNYFFGLDWPDEFIR